MSHIIDYADGQWVAVIDTTQPTGHRPMTPKVKMSAAKMDDAPGYAGASLPATWPALLQLSNTLPGAQFTPEASERAQAMGIAAFAPWNREDLFVPEGLTPYPWQVTAASRFPDEGKLLLSDDPGTGKTISAILAVLQVLTPATRVLVVAPATVVPDWHAGWQKWAPQAASVEYAGPKRRKLLADGGPQILNMSYNIMHNDHEVLNKWLGPYDIVILDEHHMIKNPQAMRTRSARVVAAGRRVIALSGTPITKTPLDVFTTLQAMDPASWASKTRYIERYLDHRQGEYSVEILGLNSEMRDEFNMATEPFHRRIAKKDALPWLPEKVYTVREVEMPPAARARYEDMRDKSVAQLEDGAELNAFSTLAVITRLQQLAAGECSVAERIGDGDMLEYDVKMIDPSWKVDALEEIVLERSDEQIVVFSQFRQLVDLAAARMKSLGIPHTTLVGGMTAKQKTRAIEDFQAGRARVIVVSTQAGGVGITLTAASCGVFLSRPWSLVDSSQAEDRIHRIGSEVHQHIDIVDIVARDTIDTKIRHALVDKAEQLGDFLKDPRLAAELLGGKP